jgi:hypothetical protein
MRNAGAGKEAAVFLPDGLAYTATRHPAGFSGKKHGQEINGNRAAINGRGPCLK